MGDSQTVLGPQWGRRRPTRHREPTRSGGLQPGGRVWRVESFHSGFPPSLNSLHFSLREAVEKTLLLLPLIETLPLDLGVEGLELKRSRVNGPTVHRSPSGRRTAQSRTRASG